MIKALALLAMLHAPAPPAAPGAPPWFGADKVKHFLMSAFVQSTAFSVARAAGVARPNAQFIGGVSTTAVGVWKEVHDRRRKRPFSVADLVWDGAGGLAAAALMNGTR